MVNLSSMYKIAALLSTIIIVLCLSAGCVGNVTNNTSISSIDFIEDSTDDSIDDSSLSANESLNNQVISSSVIPLSGSLCRGEKYSYTDAARNNKMAVTVVKDTGKFTNRIEYLDASLDKKVTLTPEPGKKYYYLFIKYWHTGIEDLEKDYNVTTPNLAFHRLIDADGKEYRPISLNSIYTYSFYGKNYVPTALNRWDSKTEYEGYLLFEVPENFVKEGAYLSVNLGKWGTPKWRLWG